MCLGYNVKRKKFMKVILLSIFTIFAFSQVAMSQFYTNLEVNSELDDNIFRAPEPTEDFISNFSADVGYRFNNVDLQINYNGNFIFFRSLKERNLSLHRLELNTYYSFGKEDLHTLFLGINGLTRIDGEEYKEYDYSQLYAYANIRFDLESVFIKTGYNFRFRDYVNFSELNNLRHFLFLQFNKSFVTRTTAIIEANLGYKAFTTPISYTTLEGNIRSGGGNGPGSGMLNNSLYTATISSSAPPMGQLIFIGRISQSIVENLGIFIQYRKQFNLSDQITSITGNNYYQDEELFDDPFSYEGKEISSQLTWMMPWSMRLQIGGSVSDKNYINELAYTSAIDSVGSGGQRTDDQNNLFLNLTKTYNFNGSWLKSLMLNVYLEYANNESNSYWYNYKNRLIGGSIQWRF